MAHQQDPGQRSAGEVQALSRRGETIAAIATPAGRGGIGIVRVSGAGACAIATAILGAVPAPRQASLLDFRSETGDVLDRGIALYFPAPHSYTGEDVLELQGHGGPVVMGLLLRRCVGLGARLAGPGEFTRRAFLNERLDLAQAEAVADLIDAASAEAATSAARSLAGAFSQRILALVDALTLLRAHVEACIDFPEEEINPADREAQASQLGNVRRMLSELLREALQGAVLRDGLTVVLVGRPNVGKSSLLNRLAGDDLAIVTPVPGTTRDPVRATVVLEGVPIHLIDTAGLRESGDEVERIGMERTWQAVAQAGAAMLVIEEGSDAQAEELRLLERMPPAIPVARVVNKIDLGTATAGITEAAGGPTIYLSAKTGDGAECLRAWLLQVAGWRPHGEGVFMARERHLNALHAAQRHLEHAQENLQVFELFAEDLRLAQLALGRITGRLTADDLLGEIFSRFCIGK